MEFIRAFVRPFIGYIGFAAFTGLVIYAFVKYGSPDLAQILVVAFVEMVGMLVAFYYGQRTATKGE